MNIRYYGKKACALSAIWIFLLTGPVACAQQSQKDGPPSKNGPPSTDEFFQRFDKDKDNKLSLQEFPGPDDHFSQFDKNKDGFIEKDEMPNVPPPPKRDNKKGGPENQN